jgi:2'-5' RNA ligase
MSFFIAIPIVAGRWYEKLATPPARFSMFHAQDLHLTVAFLGACGDEKGRAAFEAIDFSLAVRAVTFGAVVPMGNPRHYSALSAELAEGRAEVEHAMSASRGAAWTAAEAEPDLRPAKAHLTIARPARRASNADRRAGLAWAESLHLEGVSASLEMLALYTHAEHADQAKSDARDDTAPIRRYRIVAQRAL